MSKIFQLVVLPEHAADSAKIISYVRHQDGSVKKDDTVVILKKSIDARQKQVKMNLKVEIFGKDEKIPERFVPKVYKNVADAKSVIVVGAGPAGLFAGLRLIQEGLKPIVIERGLDVQARRRDLAALNRKHIVNPESNYCFGEGGAGTYSDGKLYTRSTKRGDVESILETLVQFGAHENILTEAHPHIGTNKLPQIIAAIRNEIIACGGEVKFQHKVTDLILEDNSLKGVICNENIHMAAEAVILATGHSARDIFQLLHDRKILIEFKPFALGVRAEHPQEVIDTIQYHCDARGAFLPPASYSLVHQVNDRGVYSFCMCPGGIIAPCATSPGEIVTNGWSPSKRNNPWANSGIVVSVNWEDIPEFHKFGPLAGLEFQKSVEQKCWEAGGKSQTAPAQRISDFIIKKKSTSLPTCSYHPGIVSVNMHEVLPPFISKTLQEGFVAFGKKMKGYLHPDAIIVGPESRTSSPVRIPRNQDTMMHPEIEGLYPCGEGAGFAGGIVSAAIDGEKIAKMIAEKILAS
jgi:uncharacterized FAD-dependent dehydrogenase